MTKEKISIDELIAFLNELIALDRPAMAALLANRVPCNQALAEHPTVQATVQHGGYHVGMFGIINGIFGVDGRGFGHIRYVFSEGELIRFERNDSGMQ